MRLTFRIEMKNLQLLVLIAVKCCCVGAYGQSNRIPFEHIGTQQGLSESNILSIIQDSRGFMWFGTWDGLNKYDGYKITVYKNNPLDRNSISNNYINNISEGKDGNLWIATNDGLNFFDRKKEVFKRFTHDEKNDNSIGSNILQDVLCDASGLIWIGTAEGLDRYDPSTNRFEHLGSGYDKKSKQGIRTIYEDSRHNIWICVVDSGICLYNPVNKRFTRIVHDDQNTNTIAGNNVNVVFEDSKHRVWLGNNGLGLDMFDPVTRKFHHFKHDDNNPNSLAKDVVLSINEDAEHNLWVGTENAGLSLFNSHTGSFIHYRHDEIDKESISNNSIYSIYRDNKGNMWLGNFAGYIDMAIRDKLVFPHFKRMMNTNSLCHNQVLSITEDKKNKIWIGTDGGGLSIFDPKAGKFTHLQHRKNDPSSICGNNVLNTMEDSRGNTWIGTWIDGITVLDSRKKVLRHFKHNPAEPGSLCNNNAWKIFEDRDKNIWIGTYGGGVDRLNADGKSFTHYRHSNDDNNSIASNNIINIFEDSGGDLWFCSENNGLDLLNKQTNTFTHFQHHETANSISNNTVNSIFEDSDHNLWIATMNGLNLFNKKTRAFKVFTTAQGLAGDYVFGILEDDKRRLWISTNKGISCFNRATGSFQNYGVADGLQSSEFKQLAVCKTKSGMMYFGGIDGFNQFFPDSIHTPAFDPPIVITGFTIFNKPVPIQVNDSTPSPLTQIITETRSITLPWSNSVFSFEFASLNYTSNEKKQYAYILEGFDKEWSQAGTTRTATYTNLDPGKYVFKVRGLNNEGRPSSNIASVTVIIKPPFWLTWWFKLAVFAGIFSGGIALYFSRVKSIEKQRNKLQLQVTEKTRQLQLSTMQERKARQEAELAHREAMLVNKKLEESELRYSSMFHSSPQPMFVFDIDTLQFLQVNKAAIDNYGYSEAEFLTMNIMEIRPEEEKTKVLKSISDFKEHRDRLFLGRFKHMKKSGEQMVMEIYSNIITFNKKECMLIIAIDITEKLLFENKITRAIIKTQEDERYEIGGELHDNICQLLSTSQLNISMLQNSLPQNSMPFYEQGKQHIRQALDEIRNLSHRLAPAFFDEMTLEQAFRILTDSFNVGDKYNISLYFHKSLNGVCITRDLQINLYRILQEQLRNIVKYSNAKYVSVDLMIKNQKDLVMQVSDDGVGFSKTDTTYGIGFSNMKRRAELFAGALQIDSSPGNGCTVTVTISLVDTVMTGTPALQTVIV